MEMEFEVYQDYISKDEENFMIEKFEALYECETCNKLFRRFGGNYELKIPDYLKEFCNRVSDQDLLNPGPNLILLTQYFPGKTSTEPHYDAVNKDKWVSWETCSLGLGSDGMMEFTREGYDPIHLALPRRQLMRLSGEFFNDWKHQVLPTEKLRYSLVIWHIKSSWLSA